MTKNLPRLVGLKEEGIFVAAPRSALPTQHVASLPPDHLVVLLPDPGHTLPSKFYDDKWMRENGFLRPIARALLAKSSRRLSRLVYRP
jgi:hypothetical protein